MSVFCPKLPSLGLVMAVARHDPGRGAACRCSDAADALSAAVAHAHQANEDGRALDRRELQVGRSTRLGCEASLVCVAERRTRLCFALARPIA
jgi:hypothetical protein